MGEGIIEVDGWSVKRFFLFAYIVRIWKEKEEEDISERERVAEYDIFSADEVSTGVGFFVIVVVGFSCVGRNILVK